MEEMLMADAIQRQELDIVLIVRNDKTTAWEGSSYKLEKGELGIGYYDNGKVVVKIGAEDGSKTWKDCKQVEDILEKDLILTYNFGRHTTSNGFVNAGGQGMTVSEWLEDALSVTENPDITLPEASITASFTPSSGEVGTAITAVNWNGTFTDGTYEFGSTETKDVTDADAKKKANASATWVVKLDNTQIGTTEDGSYAQNLTMGDTQTKVTLSATATLVTDAVRTPLNNVGAEVVDLKISEFKSGGTSYTNSAINATVTGYRKMFCGCTSDTLDSATIRALNLKSAKAAKGTFEVTAPVGATQIVLALPTKSVGKKYTMTKAEMYTSNWEDYTSLFSSAQTIQVADVRGGENGLQDYNVYTYSFAALKAATRFQFTVAEANA
jgi:hypothetical protein